MRITLIALAFCALTGCEDPMLNTTQYELQSGEVVSCNSIIFNACGANFYLCADQMEYFCQQNVRVVR